MDRVDRVDLGFGNLLVSNVSLSIDEVSFFCLSLGEMEGQLLTRLNTRLFFRNFYDFEAGN